MMDEKGKILLLAFELGVRILSEDTKLNAKKEPTYSPHLIYPCMITDIK